MSILFIFRYIIVSITIGWIFIRNDKLLLHIREYNRFILGISSSWVFIALADYILGLLWIGVPVVILQLLPVVLSFLYIFKCRKFFKHDFMFIIKGLADVKNWLYDLKGIYAIKYTIIFGVIVLFVLRVCILVKDYVPIYTFGSDESHYLLEAQYFAEDRNSYEIDRYTGDKEGTYQTDDHGPLWQVLLADALIFSPENVKSSIELKILFISLACSMCILMFNTASMMMGIEAGVLAVIIPFCYRFIIHFILSGSRDGFRFIVFFLMLSLIYEVIHRAIYDSANIKFDVRDFAITIVFSYLCINGHGGNAYLMLCMVIALFIILVCVTLHDNSINFRDIMWYFIKITAAIVIGIFLVLAKNICMYIRNGSFRSYTIQAYKGTSYKYGIDNTNEKVRDSIVDIFSTYSMEEKLLLLLTVGVLIFTILYLLNRKNFILGLNNNCIRDWNILINLVLFICLLLPVFGVFNFIAGDVQEWFLVQLRYRIYIYLSVGLFLGVVYAYLIKQMHVKIVPMLIMMFLFFDVSFTIIRDYPRLSQSADEGKYVGLYEDVMSEISECVREGDVLCNDEMFIYYMDKPAKYTESVYSNSLYRACDEHDIEAAIKDFNYEVFVFTARGAGSYVQMPYYKYLNTSEQVERYFRNYENREDIWVEYYIVK